MQVLETEGTPSFFTGDEHLEHSPLASGASSSLGVGMGIRGHSRSLQPEKSPCTAQGSGTHVAANCLEQKEDPIGS